MARSKSRDDRKSPPAALQPPVGRSVCRLVVALTKPIWVLEVALMVKAIYEDVHGAAETAERTKSNSFDFCFPGVAFSALRIRPLLLPWL